MAASKKLRASIVIGGLVDGTLRAAFGQAKDQANRLGQALTGARKQSQKLREDISSMRAAGRPVDELVKKYRDLRVVIRQAAGAQTSLRKATAAREANAAGRKKVGGELIEAVGVAAVVSFPIKQAMDFEDAMLGVRKQVNGTVDANGKLTASYYEWQKNVQLLGRELPIPTNEIAKLVTSAARMGIANDDLLEFARTATKMSTAFEMPADELADNMGKISTIFKLPIKDVEKLGDTINYLDDNAISKGSDIIKVMQGDLAGAASTLHLSANNAAALASTFLTLGESAERADTAASGMMRQLSTAATNPKRFQMGVKMLGLNSKKLQDDMTKDAQGTILKVLDRINKLPENKKTTAVSMLFGKDWGGAVGKLANGVAEYRKQIGYANGEKAASAQSTKDGSMNREFNARMQTTSAQWTLLKNGVTELSVNLGSALLPALNDVVKGIAPMAGHLADWARENPAIVKGVVGVALGLASFKVGLLGLRYTFSLVKAPFLVLREGFGALRVAANLWKIKGTVEKLNALGDAMGFKGAGGAKGLGDLAKQLNNMEGAFGKLAAAAGAFMAAYIGWKTGGWLNDNVVNPSAENASGKKGSTMGGNMYDFLHPLNEKTGKDEFSYMRLANLVMSGGSVSGTNAFMLRQDQERAKAYNAQQHAPASIPSYAAPATPAAAPIVQKAGDTYHITQQPGESGEDLAKRIGEQKKTAARSGGQLYDEHD